MDAIEFVVRGQDGNIRRGVFQDIDGQSAMNVGVGEDVSLNIRRYQAVGYTREGNTLVVALADGRSLRLNGFFEGNNELYISADGQLTEVALSEHAGGIDAVYQEAQAFGKWSPDDALFFTGGPDVDTIIAADAAAVNEQPTMLAAPILAGLGGLGGGGLAAGAALVGVGLVGTGGGGGGGGGLGDTTPPDVAVTEGTISVNHVFNGEDHGDGVEIAGTGEPGAAIVVVIGDAEQETVVADDGSWSVVFPTADVAGGERDQEITVTATDATGNYTMLTDTIRLDTITTVELSEIDGAVASSNTVINAEGHANGVTMSGAGEPGASITVEVAGGPSATTTVADDGTWAINFTPGEIATGEYEAGVTVTAIDLAGNSATTTQTMVVDTISNVSITGNSAGADGVVNSVENTAATAIVGAAQAGSSVVVTVTGPNGNVLGTQTVTANSSGEWQASYAAGTFPGGEYDVSITAVATDGAGNSSSTSATLPIDTLTNVELSAIDGDLVNSGAVINAAERSDGVSMSGTGEPGGAIVVTVPGGGTATTTVGSNGQWSVNFAAGDIPAGETTVPVSVSITDAAGNTASSTQNMVIDTVTTVDITGNNAGTDGVYNNAEAGRTVTLNGTAQPNASVEVTLTSDTGAFLGTTTVVANGAGQWAANFSAGSLPGGEYGVNVSAQATDAAGNTATDTSTFQVDTVADISVNDGSRDDGGVINIVEAGNGVTLTGSTDPNSVVSVNFAGSMRTVQSDGSGNWAATFSSSDIPMGVETTLPITASFTDAAGNTATATGTVGVDTIVRNLGVSAATGDGVIDAQEAGAGFTLTGTTEQGAQSVTVAFGSGQPRNAVVDAAGNWSITFAPGDIPEGEYDTDITVTTVDINDNVDSVTSPVRVDTEVPEAPIVIRYVESTNGINDGLQGISTELTDDISGISQINAAGQVSNVGYQSQTSAFGGGRLDFEFDNTIPNGASLVIQAEDSVGNQNDTLLVLEDAGTNTVNISSPALDQFDIGAIDLSIAEDSSLTISESDLLAMSGVSDTLIVHGGTDDVVNAAGATFTGATEVIGNQVYNVYSLGEGSLIIDSEITVNPVI
ncbi:Ig-like domain-containing protein [uncultured Litoreibacter sp.]|uniref:Ig-like domain-containing protein n=1 Tax=uncultured Litoreibacter sp. TaxID=1392394 RepID=UPI002616472D|nr:Ig-like domain-containing protein [uncultured Litoreibacter sp.]